jgi:hypothetical protein
MSDNPELVAWIRYLKETGMPDSNVEELAGGGPELEQALHLAETAAYTDNQLMGYYKYWDAVRTEKMMLSDSWNGGKAEGKVVEGIEIGEARGRQAALAQALENLIANGMSPAEAKRILGI